MSEELLLVDTQDNIIGYGEKLEVHKNNRLHRAFSIFIFDWRKKMMLLQKRDSGKYHSGGLWSNACCSHQHKDETMENALRSRLKEELGLNASFHIADPDQQALLLDSDDVIYDCGKFMYNASFEDLYEHEIDHVFLFSPVYGTDIDLFRVDYNTDEIEQIMWISMMELKKWMKQKPEEFTVWFPAAFDYAYDVLCRQARDLDMFSLGSQ